MTRVIGTKILEPFSCSTCKCTRALSPQVLYHITNMQTTTISTQLLLHIHTHTHTHKHSFASSHARTRASTRIVILCRAHPHTHTHSLLAILACAQRAVRRLIICFHHSAATRSSRSASVVRTSHTHTIRSPLVAASPPPNSLQPTNLNSQSIDQHTHAR